MLEQRHKCLWVYLVTSLVLTGFTALVLLRLSHFAWNDDEAVFILTAQAVQQGARLYDEVWFNYLPGFLQLLNAAFVAGGFSLEVARIAVMCCALLTLLVAIGLGRSMGSHLSLVFTALLLSTAPHFLALSSSVMTNVPAIGLATGAVWAALAYHRTGHCRWLALSSLALSASLWVRLMMIPTMAVLLVAVWLTERPIQRRLVFTAVLVTLTVLPLAIGLLTYNPTGFLRQFGLTYVRSKAAFELDLFENARDLVRYFLIDKYRLTHLSLLILGGYGYSTLWCRRPRESILLGAWFAPTAMMLLFHTPLYRHHLIQLLFPVVVLAALGLERLVVTLRTHHRPVQLALRYALLAITVVELVLSMRVDLVNLPRFESGRAEIGEEAVRYIRETTHPDEYVITDAHIIALEADRPVPPELTNTSRMRIKTGQLASQQVIDIALSVQPGAIVFWEKKLDSLGDFATWVACQYDLTMRFGDMRFGDRHRIYHPRRPVTWKDVAVPLNVYFGRSILLLGYSAKSQPVQTGSAIEVTLYWKALGIPEGEFRAFVRLVDTLGTIVGQQDNIPHDGQCPTRIWQPGEVISDAHAVHVDRVGAGGPYRLVVSLGDEEGHRLAPFDNQNSRFPGNRVTLSIPTVGMRGDSDVPTPQHTRTVNLGGYVKLLGYDLGSSAIQPGESITLTLYWRCLRAMTASYTVFTHLIGDKGEIRGQQDSIPVTGKRPTVGWLPNEVIADHYTIPLQQEALAGDYRVELGMYDVSTSQRLPVFDGTGRRIEHDRVLLNTPIQVGQP